MQLNPNLLIDAMPPKIQTMVRWTLLPSPALTILFAINLCNSLPAQDDIKKQGAPDPDGLQPMCVIPTRYLCPPRLFAALIARRYVGGGNSGGGVSANVIDESLLADKIKAQGGKSVEEYEREQAEKKKPKPFSGAGNSIRGGAVEAAPPSPTSPQENKHTLHLWRNGIRC